MYNKKVILLIGALIVLFLVLLLVNIFRGSQTSTPQGEIPVFNGSPRPSVIPTRSQTITYDITAANKDFQRIENKKDLSEADKKVRQSLIDSLKGESGILNQTNEFRVEYVKSPNSFMVEILNNDTEKVKKDASGWFKEHGLSNDGVCNLPVVFYISDQVRLYLQSNKQTFNPIPEECK